MDSEHIEPALRVVVYSSDREVRDLVHTSLGRRPAPDLPELEIVDVATEPAVVRAMDAGDVSLAILDGEAQPGGMGIARQLKDEIFRCPPILILTGRPQDGWLATWSRADAVVPRPVSPYDLAAAAIQLLRARQAARPVSA
jgi:DNA-binding response OmpR family regulator